MAAFANGVSRHLFRVERNLAKELLGQQSVLVNSARTNFYFQHLAEKKEHNKVDYKYEVTKDPKEWEFVERLLPLKRIPEPTPKAVYPSGWRPMKEESLKLPYFVERSKNHMLSVYLINRKRGQLKCTQVRRIHGDLWGLHDDLKAHLEELAEKKIPSFVQEGNNIIYFKGDYVYYVEQWMLSKGF